MLNKVQLIGHLGHDLELRTTPSGASVVSMSLATTRAWKGKDGERHEQTEWHRVVVWGKLAGNAVRVLAKGSLVYVEGRLRTRDWEDEAGKRSRTEVVVGTWQVLSRARGASREAEGGGEGAAAEAGS